MATKKTSRSRATRSASKEEAGSGPGDSQSAGTTKKKTSRAKKTTRKKTGSTARKKTAKSSAPTPAPFTAVRVEREIGGRMLTLETGRMAKQADGSCLARYGDSMVLATAQSSKAREDIDFFPLTVDYREKTASAGFIPGGFFKREGRPSTKEILTCRIIDRTVRPLFPKGFKKEVQVLSQTLSADRENDTDMVAAIASFAALALSSIPHEKVLGICRIGMKNDKLLVNPTWSVLQSEESRLNLVVAGHADAVMMVEGGAKEIPEAIVLEALELGHKVAAQVADLVAELVAQSGKPKMEWDPPAHDEKLEKAIEKKFGKLLMAAPLTPGAKHERYAGIKDAKEQVREAFPAPSGCSDAEAKAHDKFVGSVCSTLIKAGERASILEGTRSDGRDTTTIRPITIDVGVMPRVHGSVLFTRGETQALSIATLGGTEDQQIIDGLMPEPRRRFLLHYSFPPFSVGEVRRVGGPGRREIGHGVLAERSLENVLPAREDFPYTIRLTSEILESNGSSSMATVCAGTLALMDAGVKIKQPVAGIAMGLVMEGKEYSILSDILGSEDACGDMDFKVAGTGRGINALQMDIKCEGLTREVLAEALEQARVGRMHILREMLKVLRTPRQELSPNAPRLESLKIPVEKIGLVIGPAGRNIRAMQEDYEVKISVEDGGLCTITGVDHEKVKACIEHLEAMTAEVEVGAIYEGTVSAIKEFGAFIEILPGQEGLCHVSELSDEFIRSVTDVVRIGDKVKVKVIGIDDFGKVKLSRKALLEGGGSGRRDERPERRPEGRRDERERPEGGRDERPERRPAGRGRSEERDDRGGRGDRGARGDRDRDRGARGDRDRGDRERGERDRGDRDRDRGARGDRDRGDRERGERDRGDRDRDDRGRGERDRGDRGRSERDRGRGDSDRGDRGRDRGDSPGEDSRGRRRRTPRPDEEEVREIEIEIDEVEVEEIEPQEAEVVAPEEAEEELSAAAVGDLEEPDAFFGESAPRAPRDAGDGGDGGDKRRRRPRRRRRD